MNIDLILKDLENYSGDELFEKYSNYQEKIDIDNDF